MGKRNGRRVISFVSYNPFTDQRIDPISSADLYKYKELPGCIHDAVRRAKRLVVTESLEGLRDLAARIDFYSKHHVSQVFLDSIDKYVSADESDELMHYLEYGDHNVPVEEFPQLFGCLALSLTGELVNTLWPSDEYLAKTTRETLIMKEINPSYDPIFSIREYAEHLAVEAVRAVGFGEKYKAVVKTTIDVDSKYKEKAKRIASKAGRKKNEPTEKLKRGFLVFWLGLRRKNDRRSDKQAARDFLNLLGDRKGVVEKTLTDNLSKYRRENGLENHPKYGANGKRSGASA